MQIKTQDSLQYVFACLATHSKHVREIINDSLKIKKYFKLSKQDFDKIAQFIKAEGERLYLSSKIMEEKRWREILTVMKYIKKIICEKKLKKCWFEYLDSLDLDNHIPDTPINELVMFLEYMQEGSMYNKTEQSVITYELLLNKTHLFDFKYDNGQKNHEYFSEIYFSLCGVSVNPSLIVELFPVNITKILENIKMNGQLSDNALKDKGELVGFYKNRKTKTVVVINVNNDMRLLFERLTGIISLNDLLNDSFFLEISNRERRIDFIERLIQSDIVSLVEMETVKYVFKD